MHELEERLSSGDIDLTLESVDSVASQLERHRGNLKKVTASIKTKTATLGIEGRNDLRKLVGSKFLQLRLKALALKCRLRDRLRARKYEKERLERSYRNVMNGESSCQTHMVQC